MNLIAKSTLLLLGIMCLGASCGKESNSVIPQVPVNIRIHTTDPLFINLAVPGGVEMVTGGSNGIIIYRRSNDEFMAFDRHCTYQVDDYCQINLDSTSFTSATDTCCGSRFLIIDGSVQEGPAARPLQQYQTSFDGTVLQIFN